MPCCLPPFRISAKILCRNNRKRPYDKEQAILLLSANKNCQLTDDRILLTEKTFILIFRVITIADSLLTSRMTPCRLLSSERSRECFEGKEGNRTMKRSEESITRMTSYRFPHHDNRSFAAASDNVLPPLSPRQQIL